VRKRSDAALERAISLDPNYIFAVAWLITNRVEQGELAKAYQDAKALIARHPENAEARFALSYVLRYGGAMEESAHECDAALSLDSGNFMWRSCSFTFDQLGNYARAMDYLQLDAGSEWASNNVLRHYIRDGKFAQAKEIADKFKDAQVAGYRMMAACIENPSSPNTASLARQTVAERLADPIPNPATLLRLIFCSAGRKMRPCNCLRVRLWGTSALTQVCRTILRGPSCEARPNLQRCFLPQNNASPISLPNDLKLRTESRCYFAMLKVVQACAFMSRWRAFCHANSGCART
jgi:hypothetical protein